MKRSGWLGWSACLLLLFFEAVAPAQQNPDGILPVTQFADPLPLLIRDPLVLKDLKVNDKQLRALTELNDKLDMLMWTTRNQTAERGNEIYQDVSEKSREHLKAHFNQTQLQRLQEIQLWTIGTRAFLAADVIKRLAMDEAQQKKVREIISATQEQVIQLQKKAQEGEPVGPLEQKLKELRLSEQKQVAGALTREQISRYVALLGNKIDLAKLGRVKFKAPELRRSEPWLNSSPLTMRELKGKVVALHFWTFG